MKKRFLYFMLMAAVISPVIIKTMDNKLLQNILPAGQSICGDCYKKYTVLEKNKLSCGHMFCTPCLKATMATQITPLQCLECLKENNIIVSCNKYPITKKDLQQIYEDEYHPTRLVDFHLIAGLRINWNRCREIKRNALASIQLPLVYAARGFYWTKNKFTACIQRKKLKRYQTSAGAPVLKKRKLRWRLL